MHSKYISSIFILLLTFSGCSESTEDITKQNSGLVEIDDNSTKNGSSTPNESTDEDKSSNIDTNNGSSKNQDISADQKDETDILDGNNSLTKDQTDNGDIIVSDSENKTDKENIDTNNSEIISDTTTVDQNSDSTGGGVYKSDSNRENRTVTKTIKTSDGSEVIVTEDLNYPVIKRENKKIAINLPDNLVLSTRGLKTRSIKSLSTQTISAVRLSIYYPNNLPYLENLLFQQVNGVWEVEIIDFPVIAEQYRFEVNIFDETNQTIMQGDINQSLTDTTESVVIPISFVQPKEVLLSLLTDVVIGLPRTDGNISITFKVSNPSNDTNLTYQIINESNGSNFLYSDGNISSAEYSEADLLVPNTFDRNVSYRYKFVLRSGDGNVVSKTFKIFIPLLTSSPKISLLFPTETKNVFISINDTNITLEAIFDNSSQIVDTNWSLLNNSFTFDNRTLNPTTILGFEGNISDTVVLKILNIDGIVSTENYVLNLNDEVAPEIPTVISPNITNIVSPIVIISGEPKAQIVINRILSGQFIGDNGSFDFALNLANEGENNISIALEDASSNRSDEINITIFRDTTPPNTDSTITFFETDSISPNLIGTLPTSSEENISRYVVKVFINDIKYLTENNGSHWIIPAGTVADLEEGYYDLNISASDDLNNTSNQFIQNAFRVKYSAFLTTPKIEGLYYLSGSKTGITNISGMFKYENGGSLSLYLGNESSGINLGTIELSYLEDENLSFLKLINGSDTQNSQKAINIIRLLASLDADKDLSNGILIDSETAEAFVLANPDFDLEMNSSDFSNISEISDIFNDLAPHFGEHRGLISAEDGEALVNGLISGEIVNASYSVDEGSTITILSGTLQTVEGAVEGINFRSGAQSGMTDENGTFYYEDGKKIRFSIGMMEFSETLAKSSMSPLDMVESVSFDHPKPRNIVNILTMFDAILDDSKVTIDKAVVDGIEKYRAPIDLNLPDGQANEDLNISASENEFLAQFNQFEICADMMEDINASREASRTTSSLRRSFKAITSTGMDGLKDLQVSANPAKQVAEIYENVKDFHIFYQMWNPWTVDAFTILVNGQNGIPIFSARGDEDPISTDYPIRYNKPITRYMPVLPPLSVKDQYAPEDLGDEDTAVYTPPMVSAGTIGKGRILAMSSFLYSSVLINPRNYSLNMRNNDINESHQPDGTDMENFFHNVFRWLSKGKYSKDGTPVNLATNKEFGMFWSRWAGSYRSDAKTFTIHNNFNINQEAIINTDFENLDPETTPILILEEFGRHVSNNIYKRYLDYKTDLPNLMKYVQKGGSILIMDSFKLPDNEPRTVTEALLDKAGLYIIRNKGNGIKILPKHTVVGGVHHYDMCVQDFVGLTQLQRKVGLTTYENLALTKDGLIDQIKIKLGESGWEGGLDETLKRRERIIYKLGTEDNATFTESDCLVTIENNDSEMVEVQSQLVKGTGINDDDDDHRFVKYPVDLNFVEAQGDVGGKMNALLEHEEKIEIMKKVDVQREYTNMYALLMNDANFTGEKFESLNSLLDLYKDLNSSKVNTDGEFDSVFRFFQTRKVLNYREYPVTRIMLERAFYDPQLKFDPTEFPGKVTAGATETATIFLKKITTHSKWYARNMQSTGLFAPAHQQITITVPDGVDFTKLQLQIGVGDNVSGLIKHEIILKRPPRMVKKWNFTSNSLTVTHPYGGLIYLTSHDRNPATETATFTFDNVEKGILFKLGETTSSDWDTMKTYLAPKVEIQTKHYVVTIARENLVNLTFDKVVDIANGFDEVAINNNDFYGYDRNCSADIGEWNQNTPPTCDMRQAYRHREVFDPHISIGAGHSGYPIMIMGWNPTSQNFPQDPRNSWILWHEMGHNTVEKWLNINGATEVANNVMCLYQQHKFSLNYRTNKRMLNSQLILNKGQSYGDGGAYGRLLMFAQIPMWVGENHMTEFHNANPKYFETDGTAKAEFGFLDNSVWDIYKIMHRETRENNLTAEYRYSACATNSNLTKSENFGTCVSSILQLDLTSFLNDWEIGTIGAGVIDGVAVYDSSGGFGTAGESAISDMNLPQPSSPIQGFTGSN